MMIYKLCIKMEGWLLKAHATMCRVTDRVSQFF